MKVRVLHIIPGLDIGNLNGGAEKYAARVSINSSQTSLEFGVFRYQIHDTTTEESWIRRLNKRNVAILGERFNSGSSVFQLGQIFIELWKVVSKFRPTIIHCHHERSSLLALGIKVFHPNHPKIVRTVHIDNEWFTHPFIGRLFSSILFPAFFDLEIAISNTIQTQLSERLLVQLLHKSIPVCFNGVDEDMFKNQHPLGISDKRTTGTESKLINIGIIGRLTEQKGHKILLDAISEVRQEHQITLDIIGSGELENNLRNYVSSINLDGIVNFLGFISDVPEVIQSLDLLVSSSLWEGFPTVILEAMANHIPVIGTDISGTKELIINGKTGILVPPKDVWELARVINEFCCNPNKYRDFTENAYQLASQFTIQNSSRCLEQQYMGLLRS